MHEPLEIENEISDAEAVELMQTLLATTMDVLKKVLASAEREKGAYIVNASAIDEAREYVEVYDQHYGPIADALSS